MTSSTDLPRFACPDWWKKIKAGRTPMADVPVNREKAAKALAFFNRLRLPDGLAAGQPLKDACGDWFRDLLVAFLASEDPETGRRLVWEMLCMVPKKNSKTTYSAALGLTALYMEETQNAKMLLIGPSQNISSRCFEQAEGMVRLDPEMSKIFKVTGGNVRSVKRRKTGSELQVKTFDTTIVTGEIPVLTILDEVHELGKRAKAQAVMQQIRGGGITRTGGQLLMITTQSDEEPAGIWRSELLKARKIRDGEGGRAPIMLPVLYEFPEKLQKDETYWRDTGNWPLLLPNAGRSIDMQKLLDDYENNGSVSPEAEQIWMSQHLNIEIGLGLHSDRWTGADLWESAADDRLTDLASLLDLSEVAVVGGDLGGVDDLLGLSVIGRERETRNWLNWSRAWCTPTALAKHPETASKLRDLERTGDLRIVETVEIAVAEAAAVCAQVKASGKMASEQGVALDPWRSYQLRDVLYDVGFTDDDIAAVSQGFKLTGAIQLVEQLLHDNRFRHADQPLMRWCVGNAKAEGRGKNVYITKLSTALKIDPLAALFDAAMVMGQTPDAARQSVYEMRGMLAV